MKNVSFGLLESKRRNLFLLIFVPIFLSCLLPLIVLVYCCYISGQFGRVLNGG